MELKKSPKAELESKKNIFFMLGLVIALGVTLLAFEWTNKPSKADSLGSVQYQEVEEEITPITREQEVKPPPPPPPPQVIEFLNIVDDDVEIEDEMEIEDSEADDETVIDVTPLVMVEEEEEDEQHVFVMVEDMPVFPGGELALRIFLKNATNYPVIALENGIQGTVYVQFVVDKDGSVSNAAISRGVDPSLDREALRVVNKLPRWKPGKQRGKPVRVSYTVPIKFVLQ